MVVTRTHAKDQGLRSVGSKDKSGNMDGERRLHSPMLTRLVKIYKCTQ